METSYRSFSFSILNHWDTKARPIYTIVFTLKQQNLTKKSQFFALVKVQVVKISQELRTCSLGSS